MRYRIDLSTIARFGIAALLVGIALTGAACSDDGADPAAYFEGLERSQATLDATVGELFASPAAQAVESFVDDDTSELSGEQEQVVRQFVTEFWTGATDAAQLHRDDIQTLDVPSVADDAHRDYVAALDGLVASRDRFLAEAQSTGGAELLAEFWEPDPEIEAVNVTCLAMDELATSEGFTISLPICDDE